MSGLQWYVLACGVVITAFVVVAVAAQGPWNWPFGRGGDK